MDFDYEENYRNLNFGNMDRDFLGDFVGQLQNELGSFMKNTMALIFPQSDFEDYDGREILFTNGDNVRIRHINMNGLNIWKVQENEGDVRTFYNDDEAFDILKQYETKTAGYEPTITNADPNQWDADFQYNPDASEDLEEGCFFAPFGIYILLSILLLLLTIFLAVMCHRRRRLQYLQARAVDNREEFRAEFGEHGDQNQIIKVGVLDKPPSYEKVQQEDDSLPPRYEDIQKNIV
jgi:hypothetical protein